MLTKCYLMCCIWVDCVRERLREERGIETLEWIVLGAVVAVLLGAASQVFKTGGTTIGNAFVEMIMGWIGVGNPAG